MAEELDWRNIVTGLEIPSITYSDQPYIVKTDDGAWLCCITTGVGREGEPGQIVTTMRSTDQGKTWSPPLFVEPAGGPEASWAVLLKTPGRRIYIFYIHNSDNLRAVKADNPPYKDGLCSRVDSLGYYVFKYSDDDGRSWSEARYPIPVREMDIDRKNPYGGAVRFFWNVGRPFIHGGAAYVPMHKVGGFGEGFFTRSEGVLLKSANLLTESDPEKLAWETLPDGDFGLRTPPGGGPIAEEQSFSVLSDGSFFCVYRTIDGHAACCYSRDGGHTWTAPQYMRYADGRLMKHPRAANFAWKCANGKFLYWFHNHGGRFISEHPQPAHHRLRGPQPGLAVRRGRGGLAGGPGHPLVAAGDRPLRRRSLHPHELSRSGRGRRQLLPDRDAEGQGAGPPARYRVCWKGFGRRSAMAPSWMAPPLPLQPRGGRC